MNKIIHLIGLYVVIDFIKNVTVGVMKGYTDKLNKKAVEQAVKNAQNKARVRAESNRPYTRYSQPRSARSTFNPPHDRGENTNKSYHDVIMVAFDISGRSAKEVQQWLMDKMPALDSDAMEAMENDHDIHIDSWWIANDERYDGSDCDSAVFVSKGLQRGARRLLRDSGFLI